MVDMEPQQCPECEMDLDEVTSVCPECGWDQMTPGDHHSGPYGYTPGVGYLETQYGSGFDEGAEWNR